LRHKHCKLQGVISLSTHYLSLIHKYSPQHLIRKQGVQIHYLEQGWPTSGSRWLRSGTHLHTERTYTHTPKIVLPHHHIDLYIFNKF